MKENSNGTDKNVGSIEEDIKILERIDIKYFLSGSIEQSNYIVEKADEVNEAIEHILSDYKRVLQENKYMHNELDKQQTKINKYAKENEEKTVILLSGAEKVKKLEKEKEELMKLMVHKNGYTKKLEEDLFENASNYVIPIQKVKDKIEELRAEYEYLGEENKRVNKFEIELLQELIEGE